MAPTTHSSSSTSRLRMRRSVLVANISLVQLLCSLVGDGGADLAIGWWLLSATKSDPDGKSSDTVRFGLSENLGMGRELGGGEFE